MRRFGKADRDLPLLSRLYQTDPDDLEDLAGFVGWYFGHTGEVLRLHRLDQSHPEPGDETGQDYRRTLTEELRGLIRLVKRIMESLHAEGGVRWVDILALEAAVNKARRRYSVATGEWWDGNGPLRYDAPVVIPVAALGFKWSGSWVYAGADDEEAHAKIALATDSLLQEIQDGKPGIGRCLECSNLFVMQRHQQQWCSHKCSNTAGQRIRRRLQREQRAGKE